MGAVARVRMACDTELGRGSGRSACSEHDGIGSERSHSTRGAASLRRREVLRKPRAPCARVLVDGGSMRAAVITKPGDPDVFAIQEVDDPSFGAEEVLVAVHATALNRADL